MIIYGFLGKSNTDFALNLSPTSHLRGIDLKIYLQMIRLRVIVCKRRIMASTLRLSITESKMEFISIKKSLTGKLRMSVQTKYFLKRLIEFFIKIAKIILPIIIICNIIIKCNIIILRQPFNQTLYKIRTFFGE